MADGSSESDGDARRAVRRSAVAGEYADLAEQLSSVARELESETTVDSTLTAIVEAAVGTVPGAQHASISSVKRRRVVTTVASTDEVARRVDAAQYETGEGPCLDTLYDQVTVRLHDMVAEVRWPNFTPRAAEIGVRSMLCVQMFVQGDELGALSLSSEAPDAFDGESKRVALLFASHASIAMAGAQEQQQLRQAIDTRDLIGQAKGILMERFKLTGDRAFLVLVHASQKANRRLGDIADELVRSGELPGER